MLEIPFVIGILDVQVALVSKNLLDRHFPCSFVLFTLVPPGDAFSELLELQGLCFAVAIAPLGKRLLVVPDLAGAWFLSVGFAGFEEDQVGGDTRVGGED